MEQVVSNKAAPAKALASAEKTYRAGAKACSAGPYDADMEPTMDAVSLQSADLSVRVALRGAEIKSLRTANGIELIWHGDTIWWDYSAPVLFPIIGPVALDRVQCQGKPFAMASHGFARTSIFEVLDLASDRVTLALKASTATREYYPFDFTLQIEHRLSGASLCTEVTIVNTGSQPLPASFGFHPALRWPMAGRPRAEHQLIFEQAEWAKVKTVIRGGQLLSTDTTLPLQDRCLRLSDHLFEQGALVLDPVQSQGLALADDLGPLVHIRWTGCPQLGLWTKPGAPFVCVEPWAGHPRPVGWDGELADKPGSMRLAPGDSRTFSMRFDCKPLLQRQTEPRPH